MDVGGYMSGNCDVMALALNRLTGHPFGMFSGKVLCEDEPDGFYYEDCHAVVISNADAMEWFDVGGRSSGIPDSLYFNNAIEEVVLRPVSEGDVREAFTTLPISEESIEAAMKHAVQHVFDGHAPEPGQARRRPRP